MPCPLHLCEGLRKFTPRWVSWRPQLDVFQPVISEKTDWRHKFHIWELLRCPTIALRMYYSKPRISKHKSHWLTNFLGTKRPSTQSNCIPAGSPHLYCLAYIMVGSYFTPLTVKNGKIYSHSMCCHLSRPHPWQTEWESYFQRCRRFVHTLSQSKGWIRVMWPRHRLLSSL